MERARSVIAFDVNLTKLWQGTLTRIHGIERWSEAQVYVVAREKPHPVAAYVRRLESKTSRKLLSNGQAPLCDV